MTLNEVEYFDAIIENAKKKLEILVEPAMPCATQVRNPSEESCSVKRRRVETPCIERRASVSDKKRKANRSGRIPKVHSSQRAFADGGIHSWHHYNLVHTPVPISKATKIPSVKTARGGRFDEILLQEGWAKVTSWECIHCHRQTQLFLSAYVDDTKLTG